MRQETLDRIRRLNKRLINKVLIHISGKRFGHFAILTHTGRKSGQTYRIPIIVEPAPGGFVIALTYGKKVDWLKNVQAKGKCELRWKNQDISLVNPQFIGQDQGLRAFPAIMRGGIKRMGVKDFVRFEQV
jgi:deazaflavin-dependent oxidoreductase (nitroreductase family)